MTRARADTRDRILLAAYKLFSRKGFVRGSLDDIASYARVTKKTLYYHFGSKDELLTAVLEQQHDLALSAFKSFGDGLTGSPEEIAEKLFAQLAVWVSHPRWTGSGFTRLVMELADMPGHPALKVARRHKTLIEQHLADVLTPASVANAGARARELLLLSEGALTLALIHRDPAYTAAAGAAAKRLVRT